MPPRELIKKLLIQSVIINLLFTIFYYLLVGPIETAATLCFLFLISTCTVGIAYFLARGSFKINSPYQTNSISHSHHDLNTSFKTYLQASENQLTFISSEVHDLQALLNDAIKKLVSNFSDLNQVQLQQQSALTELSAQLKNNLNTTKSEINPQLLAEMNRSIEELKVSIDSSTTQLQFHDLTNQMLCHIEKRIDLLVHSGDCLNKLIKHDDIQNLSENDTQIIQHKLMSIIESSKNLGKDIQDSPVKQKTMHHGAIELF